MSDETSKIIERYERRRSDARVSRNTGNLYFNHFTRAERELKFTEIIRRKIENPEDARFLEIGAGDGGNLFLFKRLGFKWENMYANELLPFRMEVLKENYPAIHSLPGDALQLEEEMNASFDIVLQALVFTSILDGEFKQKFADKLWKLLKPGGFLLWYDFSFDNPKNKDVKGIRKAEIRQLFPEAKNINFHKTTLAPPIGRRVNKFYPFFNIFPFLRTHLIGIIEK